MIGSIKIALIPVIGFSGLLHLDKILYIMMADSGHYGKPKRKKQREAIRRGQQEQNIKRPKGCYMNWCVVFKQNRFCPEGDDCLDAHTKGELKPHRRYGGAEDDLWKAIRRAAPPSGPPPSGPPPAGPPPGPPPAGPPPIALSIGPPIGPPPIGPPPLGPPPLGPMRLVHQEEAARTIHHYRASSILAHSALSQLRGI